MMLNWKSILPFDETIRFTIEWYKEFYNNYSNIEKKSIEQIMEYVSLASKESMDWTD